MKTIKLPGCVVVQNDNAHTLPESRRVEESHYSLIESGLGHTVADFDQHFNKMVLFSAEGDTDALVLAINNFRYLLDNLLSKEKSPNSLAFAVLVETIDGVQWTDYTEDGLKQMIDLLSQKGLTDEIITRELTSVKKKSTTNWPTFFRQLLAKRKTIS